MCERINEDEYKKVEKNNCVSYLLLHKKYSQIKKYKRTNLLLFQFLWIRNPSLILAGCLWLKFSHKTKVKVSAGTLISSKCSTGIGSTSTLALVILDRIQLLWVVGLRASVPHLLLSELRPPSVFGHMTLTIGQLTIRQLVQSKWENKKVYPTQKPWSSCNLTSEVTCHYFYYILFTRVIKSNQHLREGYACPRTWTQGGSVHRRPSQRLHIPIIKENLCCPH